MLISQGAARLFKTFCLTDAISRKMHKKKLMITSAIEQEVCPGGKQLRQYRMHIFLIPLFHILRSIYFRLRATMFKKVFVINILLYYYLIVDGICSLDQIPKLLINVPDKINLP